jgi:diadenylate cyclase
VETVVDYLYRIGTYNKAVVVVELLFIGLVVYWAVNFLEGTRGERLFKGVIFILIAGSLILNFVVEQFVFERLQYLYKGFLITVLIIAVAAFQPEIRRALIRIGQPRFLRSSTQQLSRTVEEIITAVKDLSATHTGAIIVIEQQVGLGEFIDTGVRIDAKVTSQLLETIFHPGTALHDMAVIIQGDRIIAARVQLPLAESDSVDGMQLGSRHRAAIGITTGSDATVVVVSEESGTVSLALNGNLMRGIADSQLRRHLTTAMVETMPFVERFWKTQKKNNTTK